MEYDITLSIKSAEGTQTFRVDAENEEDALRVFNASGGKIVESDVEVQQLEAATLDDVSETS